jgi:hypothetical protein
MTPNDTAPPRRHPHTLPPQNTSSVFEVTRSTTKSQRFKNGIFGHASPNLFLNAPGAFHPWVVLGSIASWIKMSEKEIFA